MTSIESIVHAVEKIFKNTMLLRKDMLAEHLCDRCPTIEKFKMQDEKNTNTTLLTIFYDDVTIKARLHWRNNNGSLYNVLDRSELVEVINNK